MTVKNAGTAAGISLNDEETVHSKGSQKECARGSAGAGWVRRRRHDGGLKPHLLRNDIARCHDMLYEVILPLRLQPGISCYTPHGTLQLLLVDREDVLRTRVIRFEGVLAS